jgi:O-antigen/teichoic acid export membrane protein
MSNGVSLRDRILKAGAWTLVGFGAGQAIRLAGNLLMTRLLVPEMFGLMAIALMFMQGLALFSDFGLRQGVVQSNRGDEEILLNTVWVTQICRGLLIFFLAQGISLLLVMAHHAAVFRQDSAYAHPSLATVVSVLSIAAILNGFESTKVSQASRTLALRLLVQVELVSQLVGLITMILFAAFDRSIWVLVGGALASALTKTLLSHVWLPGTANRWQWSKPAFDEILGFGKWIFGASILGFLVNSGDRAILGFLIDARVLGIYVIAFLIFNSVEQVFTRITADVAFPALSEVARNRSSALRSVYYRFHTTVALGAYFCGGALMVGGQEVIELLYDRRYADAGWMLQILSFALLTVPFRVGTQIFMAVGAPVLLMHIGAIRLVVLALLTPTGFSLFGLPGALWAIVLSYFSWLPLTIFHLLKYKLVDVRKELLALPALPAGMLLAKIITVALGARG